MPVPQPAQPNYVAQSSEDTAGFCVSDPVKGSHITYAVRGIDEEGSFEGQRRYNDFYAVRDHLMRHWPGCYIPPIPPKKATGNKADTFVEDRCFFLDRFLK